MESMLGIGVIIWIVSIAVVVTDAPKRGQNAFGWGVLTFLLPGIGLLAYAVVTGSGTAWAMLVIVVVLNIGAYNHYTGQLEKIIKPTEQKIAKEEKDSNPGAGDEIGGSRLSRQFGTSQETESSDTSSVNKPKPPKPPRPKREAPDFESIDVYLHFDENDLPSLKDPTTRIDSKWAVAGVKGGLPITHNYQAPPETAGKALGAVILSQCRSCYGQNLYGFENTADRQPILGLRVTCNNELDDDGFKVFEFLVAEEYKNFRTPPATFAKAGSKLVCESKSYKYEATLIEAKIGRSKYEHWSSSLKHNPEIGNYKAFLSGKIRVRITQK